MIPRLRYVDGAFVEDGFYAYTYSDDISKLKNIIAVSCFPNDAPLEKYCDYITQRKTNESHFLFENIYEGHVLSCLSRIYSIIDRTGIDPDRCYFLTAGLEAELLHREFCHRKDITNQIRVRVVNSWEREMAKTNELPMTYVPGIRDNLFLSFNRMARSHRIALLGLMYERGLVDKGHYSFFTEAYGSKLPQQIQHIKEFVSKPLHNKIQKQILSNLHHLPLKLNVDSVLVNPNYHMESDYQYYATSYFSLVTETFFFKNVKDYGYTEDSVFFSEKIFKPIYAKHPFIMLNRPYALDFLREMGYRTFSPYINEQYDRIENDEQRLLAIVDEVERLSKMSPREWILWTEMVKPIVDHNHKVLMSKKPHQFEFTLTQNE